MTLPDERYLAVKRTRQFLWDLADPKITKHIDPAIRNQAISLLKHYPNEFDMQRAADAAPDVFQLEMEPLTKLMAQYEQKSRP